MADEILKISQLDTLPGGDFDGFYTIGSKDNAAGRPVSYKMNLGVLKEAISQAALAVSSAYEAIRAANEAKAAFIAAIVQVAGSDTDKVMSQAAVSNMIASINNAINHLAGSVGAIIDKIPSEATMTNQLADKEFVNKMIEDSVRANLITDNGQPFHSYEDLARVTATENDYAYVMVETENGTYFDRYKYTHEHWVLEYRINSTMFTDEQWAAINSRITASLVTKLGDLPTSSELSAEFDGKVDTESGKGLSSNDYTDADKEKLGSITYISESEINSICV